MRGMKEKVTWALGKLPGTASKALLRNLPEAPFLKLRKALPRKQFLSHLGTAKGVITKGVFSLEESLESLKR